MFNKLYARYKIILPVFICLLFFITYSTLSIVRHQHYQSFGYDLGINDQVVWRYSHFQLPLTTIDPFPTKTKLAEHVELVYALVAPFYWIWSSRRMLILVRTAWFCFSAVAVYLLAKNKGVNELVSLALTIGYLGFYGVQNDMWADVHSIDFAAGFLMWFIYFAEIKKKISSIAFFFLAITAVENIALLTFLASFVLFIKQRSKLLIFFMLTSVAYLFFIYFIYFPHIAQVKYLFENHAGLFSNLNPITLVDTNENRQVFWYSLLSFGFMPLLSPLYLLPALGDLVTYFMFGKDLVGAQGLFGQYRITLTPFLVWASIITIGKYKKLNNWYIAAYLIVFTMLVQYVLHLPLSYLTKQWFWTEPPAVKNINTVIQNYLPVDASVVSQDNITPHISQRDKIYTLYPEKRIFSKDSPCGQIQCNWFRWDENPKFLIVDTSSDWDARHLLTDRPLFLNGLKNLEKAKVVTKYKVVGSTILYTVNENPDEYK